MITVQNSKYVDISALPYTLRVTKLKIELYGKTVLCWEQHVNIVALDALA